MTSNAPQSWISGLLLGPQHFFYRIQIGFSMHRSPIDLYETIFYRYLSTWSLELCSGKHGPSWVMGCHSLSPWREKNAVEICRKAMPAKFHSHGPFGGFNVHMFIHFPSYIRGRVESTKHPSTSFPNFLALSCTFLHGPLLCTIKSTWIYIYIYLYIYLILYIYIYISTHYGHTSELLELVHFL